MANRSTNPELSARTGYSHVETFKVAGVTFDNRQKSLKKILTKKLNGKVITAGIEEYTFDGEPAIKVIADGVEIGNIRSEDKDYIIENKDRVLGVTDLYINFFENESGEKVYYAKISFLFKNKNLKQQGAPEPHLKQTVASTPSPTSNQKPIYKKWQFWVAIGAAAVLFYIIAVVTGLAK